MTVAFARLTDARSVCRDARGEVRRVPRAKFSASSVQLCRGLNTETRFMNGEGKDARTYLETMPDPVHDGRAMLVSDETHPAERIASDCRELDPI
jgi:hypothetical protein